MRHSKLVGAVSNCAVSTHHELVGAVSNYADSVRLQTLVTIYRTYLLGAEVSIYF